MKRLLFLIVALIGCSQPLRAATPCCGVTAIDVRTGTATAVETATGRTFEFHIPNPRLFATVRVGMPVYANFSTKQVSLDGKTPCGEITQINPAPARGGVGAMAPSVRLPVAAVAMPASCPQAWLASYGGVICRSADPRRPAILLFHGLHQSAETWTKPSSTLYNFDHRHTPPTAELGTHSGPNTGVYKVGESAKLEVDQLNWFDYLRQQNFTVATWSQPYGSFEPAYISALAAFDQFVKDTAAMNPSNPPPIVLMGHSRGGLLIRKLLKERGNAGGRIRWVITLHTPHHGSEVARAPQDLAEQMTELFSNAQLPQEIKNTAKQLALQMVSPLNQMIDEGSHELAPGSPLLQSIESGEGPVEGVKYYTFGGVSPTLYRLYTWVFTPMSSVVQFKGTETYYKWEAKPVEIPGVSPMLDRVRAIVPEIKSGSGDSLVTDVSARLAYSKHETDNLNHAEVLWDRAVQQKVAAILSGGSPRSLTPKLLSPR